MKRLHTFSLVQEVVERIQETSTNEKGEEVTTTKTERIKKDRPFFLRKPYRKMFDEADLFYGVMISQGIQAGLLTRALLAKRYDNDGGVLNEKEKNQYSKLYLQLFEYQNEFQRVQMEKDEEEDKEKKKKLEEKAEDVIVKLVSVREKLQDYESAQQVVFEQTAENKARDKCILWWTLMLAYGEADDGSIYPIFGRGSFEDRLANYDEMEQQDDDFDGEMMRKFAYYTSFWYMGKAIEEGDFKDLEDYDNRSEEEKEEEASLIQNIMNKDEQMRQARENEVDKAIEKEQNRIKELEKEEGELEEKINKAVEEGPESIKELTETPEEQTPEEEAPPPEEEAPPPEEEAPPPEEGQGPVEPEDSK